MQPNISSDDDPLTNEMYREHILDLYSHPHNFGSLKEATTVQREHNTLCGDDITIELIIDEKTDTIKDIRFNGKGCAISMAAASLLTDFVKGKSVNTVKKELTAQKHLSLLEIPIGPVRSKCALISHTALMNTFNKVKNNIK